MGMDMGTGMSMETGTSMGMDTETDIEMAAAQMATAVRVPS